VTSRALTHDARDVRERGGAWGRAQRWKNDAIHVAVRAVLAASRLASPHALHVLGRAVGRAAHLLFRRARAIALANVAAAMPELDEAARRALVRRVFLRLGEHLGDAVALLGATTPLTPLLLPPADRAVLAEALAEGRGVVFASAHLGAWERFGATLIADGVPLTTVAREAYDPRLDDVYDRLRGGRGVPAIYRGRPGAGRRMVRVLRDGGVLGVLMDLRSRVPSIDVPFLGRPAPTAVGPARLALRTGAAVVVGACAPGGRVGIVRIPTSDLVAEPDRERILTARINEALSAFIRAMPEAWVWMHERYVHH
jgi:Kdo2-lipid IVA lauroyltransferase/acyltransferase